MNEIKINDIEVNGKTVQYKYDIKGDWKKYFEDIKAEISYSIDISGVPYSVLVLPLICNLLPIAWLCDAKIFVDALDKDFYDNIHKIKEGYKDMYPMLNFDCDIIATKIEKNTPEKIKNTACFFSGGVDAYTTLFRHLDEKPMLMTIWGADIKLTDDLGWRRVNSYIKQVALEFDLDYIQIRSNFRGIIKEGLLDKLVSKSQDGWWHGFQCGIALIAHATPIAYIYGLQSVYIASSFTEKFKGIYKCASDPTIDNHIHYCGCDTIHDGYELDRQGKVKYLVSQTKELNKQISLRVCWESAGGENCCQCEKCYRTILEIISEGDDPNDYGFQWTDENIKRCKKDMTIRIRLTRVQIEVYRAIQNAMKKNKSKIKDIDKYRWFLKINIDKFNDIPIKKILRSFIGRNLMRVYGKLIRRRIRK